MKKFLICLSIFLFAIILCPLGFVIFSEFGAWEGIGWIFVLTFLIYPIAFIGMGIVAGTDIRLLWYVPIASSILCLPAMCIILRSVVVEFAVYVVIYMIIGLASMLITNGVIRLIRKGVQNEEKH